MLLFFLFSVAAVRADVIVTPETLETGIAAGISQVAELELIRNEADKLGVKVWLFGGTAATYAHYVNWDLREKEGDTRYQHERFNYNFSNIFRQNQDLDLVADGPIDKIEALQKIILAKLPYTQGGKQSWEIRPLRVTHGRHEALLDNPDFLNQHTDSNSTGLVEVTTPEAGESRVKDLLDWQNPRPLFFEDVRLGRIHYYFSDKHGETPRAKRGWNPPIISVIRLLTKTFQFGLEMSPEDRARIEQIILDYDPQRDAKDPVAQDWMERNGKKMFRHAIDVEAAWRELKDLGLKKKLSRIGDRTKPTTLAWWMKRKPLKSFPVGQGKLQTAEELNLSIVAHETVDYAAYESITPVAVRRAERVYLAPRARRARPRPTATAFIPASAKSARNRPALPCASCSIPPRASAAISKCTATTSSS